MSRFIESIESADVFKPPLCNTCKHHIRGTITCTAFTQRIPKEIIVNDFDHHSPYPGDNGIQFEARGE